MLLRKSPITNYIGHWIHFSAVWEEMRVLYLLALLIYFICFMMQIGESFRKLSLFIQVNFDINIQDSNSSNILLVYGELPPIPLQNVLESTI